MMIIAAQKAASIHNGENTHHQDQVMTLHHFRTANTAQSNAGHPNLNKTLFLIVGSFDWWTGAGSNGGGLFEA